MEKTKEDVAESRSSTATKKVIAQGAIDSRKIEALADIGKLAEASITQIVDGLVRYAYLSHTSDIHIEPSEDLLTVRFRIDGILHDVLVLPKKSQPMVIARIKILSELRTDEHSTAQDGRFRIIIDQNSVDLRVSIVPCFYGENVVMRLLVGQARALSLEELGLYPGDLKKVEENIKKSFGMILATGPTGSGKTTTLYSILELLNLRERSIVTIEDPVEYAVAGITQIQVNTQTNLTFALGLRAMVRQDPNIIMVGEIRDEDTAGIAVNAAMTGHLLLSTLHTNDAAITLPRLLDMGIEPFLIASTVNIAIGQRLVRKLCANCMKKRNLTQLEYDSLRQFLPAAAIAGIQSIPEPVGCASCNLTGYIGRIGIYEVLEITEQIRHMIMKRENADEIRKVAIEEGMTTIFHDGIRKVSAGITSLTEVFRVIHE